ncbi:MAG TPA: DUF4838 domain-containing protein [Clostridiales bacterium]|nr:DUF4838 domain-containing protein [Clostridiales bacterium]
MYIVKNRNSAMKIVISENASISVRHAARELQHFLRQMTGVTMPIKTDNMGVTGSEIYVGYSKRTEQAGIFPHAELGGEGYVIKHVNGNLIIAGNDPRGTLYGVYSFLEEYCGCRWYTSDFSYIPQCKNIELDDNLDITYSPVFEYRETFYYDSFDGDFAVRNHLNGMHMRLKDEHGDKIKYAKGYFVHTFSRLVPPEKYYDDHPEYFALRNGVRERENAQLCLTNPDVLKISIEKTLDELRKNPDVNIISISQNDGTQPCTCPQCQAVVEEEGSEAGPILRYVNKIAEEVEKEFPNVAIDTLAYDYSRNPLKITKPRSNVIIRLCSFECCFSHPLDDCRQTADLKKRSKKKSDDFAGDVEKWSKISNKLYIWDYVTNFEFYQLFHPNLHILAPNIRFFARNNVKGVFEQGNGQGEYGEMAELRTWLLAKLLWDPDFDVEKGMNEFLAAWFGPAAGAMREYINLMKEALLESGYHISLYDAPKAPHITVELLSKADEIFDRAEKLTSQMPIENRRVRKERVGIKYARFFNEEPGTDREAKVEEFMNYTKDLRIKVFSEKWGSENIRRLAIRGVWPPNKEDSIVIRDK